MLIYRNNSDTLIIVVHEIYGHNDHIKGVCQSLSDSGYDIDCPDLLDGKPPFDYAQEEEAYRYFLNFVDFEPSEKKITFLLRQEEKEYKQIFLLGYSAGATIAWLCSELNVKCDGVIGFYGSRIRDYTETTPKCPVLLIYSEEEKSFDPYELREGLNKKENVEVHILDGKHGFADPYNINYNEMSTLEANRITKVFLAKNSDTINKISN